MYRFGKTLLICVLILGGVATTTVSAQHLNNWTPTRTYTDAAHGVTFRTPPTWKPTTERPDTFNPSLKAVYPMLMQINDPAPTVMFFDPSPSLYAHTSVTGLYFIYSVKLLPDAAACDKFASGLPSDETAKARQVTLNGIQFTARYSDELDGNTRDGTDGTLYSTFRSGTCYLFETTATLFDRSNGSADDDYKFAKTHRPIPWAAIHAHLFDIMRTVRIPLAGANSSR
jgi:hypothetical protein